MRLLVATSLLVFGALAAGCGGEGVDPGPLVDPRAWQAMSAERDPMADHRPSEVICAQMGWIVEEDSLEIDTGACNYLSVTQALMRDVPQGSPVAVELWHQVLHAEDPAMGHAALFVDSTLVWERRVPIPSAGAVWLDDVEAPRSFETGDSVVFHLHNHGANTWRLGEVRSEATR